MQKISHKQKECVWVGWLGGPGGERERERQRARASEYINEREKEREHDS